MLAGKRLNDNQWSVDGASGCLVPAGKPGPFRTSVRWNAAVDRLSGASERHGTACIEFREGCGLWTVVGFPDEAARDRWQEPVKAAFRLLADSGFGGERSRGWGRSETPEFVEGMLPGLIIEYKAQEYKGQSPSPPVEEPPTEEPPIEEPPPTEEPVPDPNPPMEVAKADDGVAESEAGGTLPDGRGSDESAPEKEAAVSDAPTEAEVRAPDLTAPMRAADEGVPEMEAAAVEAALSDAPVEAEASESTAPTQAADEGVPEMEAAAVEAALSDAPIEAEVRAPELTEPMRAAAAPLQAHWLLSLFTPAADDTVDWGRGSYSVLARGGRVDSPAGSGELKKQIQMVAEGSVLYANGIPLGAAADVAPDGFAHPVFRAGFALAIRLPEVH